MTKEGFNLDVDRGRKQRFPAHLTVAASQTFIDQFKAQIDGDSLQGFHFCVLDPLEPIPDAIIDSAQMIVVEVEQGQPQSMQRVVQIHARRPELPQIVALADANISTVRQLLRQGVADVLSLPLQIEEVYDSAANILENVEHEPVAKVEAAPLVAVVRSRGGEGSTTILSHLAQQLALSSSVKKGVCIIDLDVQVGGVTHYLGITPRRSVEDLLMSGDRLDPAMLKSVAVDRGHGLHVIAAPFDIQPLEQIDTEQLLKVVHLARQEFDFVLLDLPTDWTHWNLSTLLDATEVLMVVELQISSLRQAKRRLELFRSVGIDPASVAIVVNRAQRKLFRNIDLKDVSEALKRKVLVSLSDEGDKLSAAQDQGLLLPEMQRNTKFNSEMKNLADMVLHRCSRG